MSEKLGATGEFPEGKIAENDEGEIRMAIGVVGKSVVVDFGKRLTWIGFTADGADEMAAALRKAAQECRQS